MFDFDRDNETAALITLLRQGDRPWHHYAELVEAAGSAIAVLRGDYRDPDLPPTLFETRPIAFDEDLGNVIAELRAWHTEGLKTVTVLDRDYPRNLRTIHNRPPVLFIRGALEERDDAAVAIVGTRNPSSAGRAEAAAVAQHVSEAGYTIVSGLAAGIDAVAHRTALDLDARTIAVIGTGIRRAYPLENQHLQEEIADRGAVISQFWPDAPPTKRSFPMRNIVMSGLALATVVVEASDRSGARMQARFALEHGRPVFLLKRLLEYEWATRYASRPGTYVVDSGEEIVEHVARFSELDGLRV